MARDRRRSDRLLLTIPLRVEGSDPTGIFLEARTISVNRHGARIQTSTPLSVGQTLHLVNQISRRKADFRVVGPVAPPAHECWEWGIECLDSKDNIWGIRFPPLEEGGSPKALLECRKCHTVALLPISLVEVEVLETAGIISRQCQSCEAASPWGYTEKQLTMEAPPEETAMLAEADAQIENTVPIPDRRRHRRACLQLPVLVRDYYGGVEETKSENVCKGGFCFASEKNYYMGQGIMTVCPFSASDQDIEVRARIVHRREWKGSQRKVYGVRYVSKAGRGL